MSESVPEPQPDKSLDARVATLETGQEGLTGKVDEILGILKGGGHDDKPTESTTTADPAPADMAEQMRQAVRDVQAERDQAGAGKSKPEPEKQPREAGQPFRTRLAEVIHGKEPRK